MARRNISIVHWFPELEKHKCGYCKQTSTNCSYGMWAESLTIEDYQYLIDRGWRRSGKYCYKPVMDLTCCPLYTIRCEALNFKITKSQKKIIKRVNRYLSDSVEEKGNDTQMHEEDSVMDAVKHDKTVKNIDLDKIDTEQINLICRNKNNDVSTVDDDTFRPIEQSMCTSTSSLTKISEGKYKPGIGADPTKPPCKKAKQLRLERKQQKLAAKGITTITSKSNNSISQTKSLEEFIEDISENPAHKLKVSLVLTSGSNRDWTQIRRQEYEIYKKYQMTIHGDPADKCTEKQFTNFLLESPLQIVLKQMHPKEPTYNMSAEIFAKYQMYVHNETPEECDVNSFKEFLVDSPLQHVSTADGPPQGFGSFHQQYWLDDKLIAVGVIDILPKCISSVYFFYDPDYRHLTLGTYGSLRELYFVRHLHNIVPSIKYYYMGFYIHSCPKMRYKAKLAPSYLLCPETYVWFPIEHCIPKLDQEKYCRFNEDLDAVDKNGCNSPNDIDQLMVLIGYKGCIPYKYLKDKLTDHEDYFRFGNLIGKKCVPRILMVSRNADF